MQKIVFGIAAVFFVQIGFQIYIAIERTNDDYKAVAAIDPLNSASSSDIAAIPDLGESDSPSRVTEFAPRVVIASAHRRESVHSNAVQHNSRSAGRFSDAGVAKSVPIKLPVPAVPQRGDFNTVSASAAPRPEKKRSFFSKVIKKPYDWLKTAVSKL